MSMADATPSAFWALGLRRDVNMVLCLPLSTRQWRLNELAVLSRLVRNSLSLLGPDNEKVVIKPDLSLIHI